MKRQPKKAAARKGAKTTAIKPLNLDEIRNMSIVGMPMSDIALLCGVHRRTIERRARNDINIGRAMRRHMLRKWQWKAAEEGSIPMLIWLGKQELGQSDKIEQTVEETRLHVTEVVVQHVPEAEA